MVDLGLTRKRIVSTPAENVPEEEHRALTRTLVAALEMAEAAGNADGAQAAVDDALERLFEERMAAISQSYFGEHWTAENAYSIWARLTDDTRAWGYGSESEIAPLRWLVDVSGRWFDGQRLLTLTEWSECYDRWAAGQEALVRRVTPGALSPEAFPPSRLES